MTVSFFPYLSYGIVTHIVLFSSENLSTIRREGIVVTGSGKLNSKYIFHVKLKGSIDGWKTVISSCLQLAETIGVTSLSFPALGTGRTSLFSFNEKDVSIEFYIKKQHVDPLLIAN